eukprot:gene17497-biopygen11388
MTLPRDLGPAAVESKQLGQGAQGGQEKQSMGGGGLGGRVPTRPLWEWVQTLVPPPCTMEPDRPGQPSPTRSNPTQRRGMYPHVPTHAAACTYPWTHQPTYHPRTAPCTYPNTMYPLTHAQHVSVVFLTGWETNNG